MNMKNKKAAQIIISCAFVLVVALIIAATFSLTVINVECDFASQTNAQDRARIDDFLNGYLKRSLLIVDTDEIEAELEKNIYLDVTVEKSYPCTLQVRVKERREVGAVAVEGGYAIFTSDGLAVRISTDTIGVAGNKLIPVSLGGVRAVVGEKLSADDAVLLSVALSAAELSEEYAENISEITFDKTKNNRMTLIFREGAHIALSDCAVQFEGKLGRALELFDGFTAEEKTTARKIIQYSSGIYIIDTFGD